MRLFRNRQQRVEDAAGRWLARMRAGPSERDRREFAVWYESDPSHRAAYDGLAGYWDASPELHLSSPLAGDPGRPALRAPRLVAGKRAYALAAVLVAGIGLATFMLGPDPTAPSASAPREMLLLATAVGEIREVPLGGGARLILDTDSAVRVGAVPQGRRLELRRGRARVDVGRRSGPFLLRAGTAEIEAKGAVFDVRLEGGSAIVTAVDGEITVRTSGPGQADATRIVPRQSLAVAAPDMVRLRAAPDRSAQWPSGMLEFDRAPLGDVVAEANRYSRRKLRLADPGLASLRVTGAFQAGDVEELARSLAVAFDLDLADARGGDLVLRPRGLEDRR